jgi:hypothetical protein
MMLEDLRKVPGIEEIIENLQYVLNYVFSIIFNLAWSREFFYSFLQFQGFVLFKISNMTSEQS